MRLSEQREALPSSSRATSSPSSRHDESNEPHFPTDEDTLNEHFDEKSDKLGLSDDDKPVWLVGDHCTIADLSFLTWANVVDRIGIDLETEFPVPPSEVPI
jgi:glutathione S-transferase